MAKDSGPGQKETKKKEVVIKNPKPPKAQREQKAPKASDEPKQRSAPAKSKEPEVPNISYAATTKEKVPMRMIWISMASCFITVQYGYNMWLLYSPFVLLHDLFNITTFEQMDNPDSQMYIVAITIALFPLGAIFGTIPLAFLANKFGRRNAMKITTFLCLIPPVLLSVGDTIRNHEFTIAVRFYTGICTGLVSIVVPLYLGEIAPGSVRGTFIMLAQLFYTLGIFAGQLLVDEEIFFMQGGYFLVMGISGIMPLFEIILLLAYFPESPRYLFIQMKNAEGAREVLKVLRGKDDVENEMNELHQEDIFEKAEKNITTVKLLSYENLRFQVIMIVALTSGGQLNGISAVYYFIDVISKSVGVDPRMALYLRVLTLIIGAIALLIAMYLIDIKGERYLLLVGFGICSIICILITLSLEVEDTIEEMAYVNLLLIQVFVIAHSIGPGPVPNIIVVRMFFQSTRASAFVIAGFVQWFSHLLMMMLFLQIVAKFGTYSFLLFLPFCGGLFFYLFKNFPETRKKTFVDIRRTIAAQKLKKARIKKPTAK